MPDKAWKAEKHQAEWRIGDTINASIGQGYVLTSPLQLAVMTARLAAGTDVSPRLVRSIAGQDLPGPAPAPLGVSAQYLRAVQAGMDGVVNNQRGTGYGSRVVEASLAMAGKSGTAQVRNISTAERARGVLKNDQLPWGLRDHALFVAYAPVDAPKVAVSVVVEHGGGGSSAAAPVARDVLLRALTGGMPPLSAYPSSQRARIETQQKELKLRTPEQPGPVSTRA
jgi:penicillin-binding protein 2